MPSVLQEKCCCYRRVRDCATGEYVDLWISPGVSGTFKTSADSPCYYIVPTDPLSKPAGTIVDNPLFVSGCESCGNTCDTLCWAVCKVCLDGVHIDGCFPHDCGYQDPGSEKLVGIVGGCFGGNYGWMHWESIQYHGQGWDPSNPAAEYVDTSTYLSHCDAAVAMDTHVAALFGAGVSVSGCSPRILTVFSGVGAGSDLSRTIPYWRSNPVVVAADPTSDTMVVTLTNTVPGVNAHDSCVVGPPPGGTMTVTLCRLYQRCRIRYQVDWTYGVGWGAVTEVAAHCDGECGENGADLSGDPSLLKEWALVSTDCVARKLYYQIDILGGECTDASGCSATAPDAPTFDPTGLFDAICQSEKCIYRVQYYLTNPPAYSIISTACGGLVQYPSWHQIDCATYVKDVVYGSCSTTGDCNATITDLKKGGILDPSPGGAFCVYEWTFKTCADGTCVGPTLFGKFCQIYDPTLHTAVVALYPDWTPDGSSDCGGQSYRKTTIESCDTCFYNDGRDCPDPTETPDPPDGVTCSGSCDCTSCAGSYTWSFNGPTYSDSGTMSKGTGCDYSGSGIGDTGTTVSVSCSGGTWTATVSSSDPDCPATTFTKSGTCPTGSYTQTSGGGTICDGASLTIS